MNLRDYFAGQALAGMSSLYEVHHDAGETEVANWAYQQADAMLAVRDDNAQAKKIDLARHLALGSFGTARDLGIQNLVAHPILADEFKHLAANFQRIAEILGEALQEAST